jgi:NAD(P) transhydrogenase subunit beta
LDSSTAVQAAAATDYWSMLFVLVLSTFIGLGVIVRVSRLLHTPLMSITNAISAIAVIGSILVTGGDHPKPDSHPRRHRALRFHDQHCQRLPYHRPHAEDVQAVAEREEEVVINNIVQAAYLAAMVLFILALHGMNHPRTARRGVFCGIAAMLLAVVATWMQPEVVNDGWIIVAIIAGFVVGVPLSRVPLTAVPQRTALSHAFGGLAAGLVGVAKYYLWVGEGPENLTAFRMTAIVAEIILGFLTFTGSLMAAGKLQELKWIPQRPVTYRGQNIVNIGFLVIAVIAGIALVANPTGPWSPILFPLMIALSLLFGVLLVIPIGGADMPTVISILNSYAGLSAVAMGFVLDNKLLITAGALDGSSGLILSIIMCRAMNRSFANVLFGAFGQVQAAKVGAEQKAYKSETIEGAAQVLEQASLVVIIPGYGMAEHSAAPRARAARPADQGITVKFAILVAGACPGT